LCLQLLNDTQTLILAELAVGRNFSMFGMVTGESYMGTVRAKTHVEVLQLRLDDLIAVLKNYPACHE